MNSTLHTRKPICKRTQKKGRKRQKERKNSKYIQQKAMVGVWKLKQRSETKRWQVGKRAIEETNTLSAQKYTKKKSVKRNCRWITSASVISLYFDFDLERMLQRNSQMVRAHSKGCLLLQQLLHE